MLTPSKLPFLPCGPDLPPWFYDVLYATKVAWFFVIVYFIFMQVIYVIQQHRMFKFVGENNRTTSAKYVWLQLIPGLNILVAYQTTWHVSQSLKLWGLQNNVPVGNELQSLGLLASHAGLLFGASFFVGCDVQDFLFPATILPAIFWIVVLRKYVHSMKETIISLSDRTPTAHTQSRSDKPNYIQGILVLLYDLARIFKTLLIVFVLVYLVLIFPLPRLWDSLAWLVFLVVLIVLIRSQYRALKESGQNKTIHPRYALLQLIPGFNLIVAYLMAWHVSRTLRLCASEKELAPDNEVESIGTVFCHAGVLLALTVILEQCVINIIMASEIMYEEYCSGLFSFCVLVYLIRVSWLYIGKINEANARLNI